MKIALLYQELDSPSFNGVRRPKKPTGYKDSGADILYVLSQAGIAIVTPTPNPDPTSNEGWCFPDTESGILSAISNGATHIWANAPLHSTHPLQTSALLTPHAATLQIIGQSPHLSELTDDKHLVNSFLRAQTTHHLTLPRGIGCPNPLPADDATLTTTLAHTHGLTFPLVAKIIRGRGSEGVRVVHDAAELRAHIADIGGPRGAMLEEFLPGAEGTVAVVSSLSSPSSSSSDGRASRTYTALPVVLRTGHVADVAPYNGLVPVSANSRVVTDAEVAAEPGVYAAVAAQCETVARLLDARAPVRIDVRRRRRLEGGGDGEFVLFDINMKPNPTLPGRPGRDDQASLVALAAEGLGWDAAKLSQVIVSSAISLQELREMRPSKELRAFELKMNQPIE